ncbi:class II fructose-bisphosphate aldolase [Pseudozobellia thermophila]|uniref:Tagatose 1,6-diphosphate aldolase GatY/KbaY n=1 Tax=Pseudozobellia thermophila TaxID=192903 RepID=A0A1M6NLT4_9FLAO|nr:class II fructose-bisphosphate aldolase [Pseudozobellia thermophila]SHJ96625.1 tagatose 1,6-diphosphate aldolase GatY/KbaY [Pseudozobellia thermophila]
MQIKEKLKSYTALKRGILATNFYNMETLHGTLKAAAELNEPIILQLTQSSIEYMGLKTATQLARTGLEQFGVEGWLHLDHGGSKEIVLTCLDAGFDSVMIDGSDLPFEENVQLTSEVVKYAEKYGAHVEAELGYIAKLGQAKDKVGFTSPDQAKRFVEETGVDALAVAIGTAHGFYKEKPNLDFKLLSAIAQNTSATLVLHGSSGLSNECLAKAISLGVGKINLATEIKNIFMGTLKREMAKSDEIDLRKIFPVATEKITELIKEKLRAIHPA